MNLYFRLLMIMIKSLYAKKISVLDEGRIRFRVWPLDCDINLHLTNGRYFALCDVGRFYFMGQVGSLYRTLGKSWLPITQAQEITYYKSINPLQSFEVTTRLIYWDDKYWYTEHRFLVGEKLCAVVQVRGVFVHKRKVISFRDVLALTGEDVVDRSLPSMVEHWQKLIEYRKEPREAAA